MKSLCKYGIVTEIKEIVQCPECKANFGKVEFFSSRFTAYMGANERCLVFSHQCSTCKAKFLAFVTIEEVIVDKTMEKSL